MEFMDYLIAAVIAAAAWILLRSSRGPDKKAIEEIDNRARAREEKELRDAETKRQDREDAAKEAAGRSVADRPHTDDPRADLRDRLDR